VSEAGLEAVLDYVRQERGFDFTGYKRPTLGRRVAKRMHAVGVSDHGDYLDFLEVHADEFPALFDALLINVTRFLRDPAPWRYLRETTIPALVAARAPDARIRVWSAGCASGQEAYSLAMLLAEALGEEQFLARVKVYATDVDEQALDEARLGTYPLKAAEDVPSELAERFLERTDHRVTFRRDLRRNVVFGRNDLVHDAPISRIDLLACRNVLMYFNAETQAGILRRMHFALRDDGALFLGRSEMLVPHSGLFGPLDLRCRVFGRLPASNGRLGPFPLADPEDAPPRADAAAVAHPALRDAAFTSGSGAELVVGADGTLALASGAARTLFGLRDEDLGRTFSDLELSYRPVELRSAIQEARNARTPVIFPDVTWPTPDGAPRRVEVQVRALLSRGEPLGTLIAFRDVTEQRRLQEELERSRRELEVAYEELQSTVEELETTNEELQSTNEELETTNEELQSTNEELETMNEELQSTNEEMETINEQVRDRSDDLDRANGFLETVLSAMRVGVVAVDGDGVVQVWNERSEDLWGLRADEAVGQHALSLDIGLPMERLAAPLRGALAGDDGRAELELDATNRRGRPLRCRVVTMGLPPRHARGAVLLVEELGSS